MKKGFPIKIAESQDKKNSSRGENDDRWTRHIFLAAFANDDHLSDEPNNLYYKYMIRAGLRE